jgi:hypothetical protein
MKTTQVTPYSPLANSTVQAANGINYAYRDTGSHDGTVPMVLLQHFRGNLDYWDPALIDALAQCRRAITFDNAGVAARTVSPGRGCRGVPDVGFHRSDGACVARAGSRVVNNDGQRAHRRGLGRQPQAPASSTPR